MSKYCESVYDENRFVLVSDLTADNSWRQRLHTLQSFYKNNFGSQPMFFVRVPGRVNIIGEHVDYCGYPVMPMAIDQCVLLAVGFTKKNRILLLRNLDCQKFQKYENNLDNLWYDLSNSNGPEWYKYYLCGIQGIYEALDYNSARIGMTVAVSGNIPLASGLSSSSAIVSAATLATAYVHQLPLNREELAAISARSERYIGTQGGGMDQAIAFLAQRGFAHFIEFQPKLRAVPVRLPEGACFVVANSLAIKHKAASPDFNQRVVECRLSCQILAKKMSLVNWRELTHLAQLQKELGCTLAEFDAIVAKWLPNEIYSRSEICTELNIDDQQFIQEFLPRNTRNMLTFKLRQRAHHVLQESMRVLEFRSLCEGNYVQCTSENASNYSGDSGSLVPVTTLLSQLLQESHKSLKHNYECSHPDLDRLIDISNASGIGARLTGAGWGGCIIALCDSMETSGKYIQLLKERYFDSLDMQNCEKITCSDLQNAVFVTFPSSGAEIFTFPAGK